MSEAHGSVCICGMQKSRLLKYFGITHPTGSIALPNARAEMLGKQIKYMAIWCKRRDNHFPYLNLIVSN